MFEMTITSKQGVVLRRVELTGGRPMRIGRARECEVQVGLPTMSRAHAEVAPLDHRDTWVIRDLDSTHGCTVRGEKIRELTITPGLEVELGPATARFESLTDRIGQELDAMIDDEEGSEDPEIKIIGNFENSPHLDDTLI